MQPGSIQTTGPAVLILAWGGITMSLAWALMRLSKNTGQSFRETNASDPVFRPAKEGETMNAKLNQHIVWICVWLALTVLGLIVLLIEPRAAVTQTSNATAVLHPTAGNTVTGSVTFNQSVDGVRVLADLSGLTPGEHGFHIHQWGDCSASDGKSAGGHYNPFNKPHGGPADENRHVGDLGNIEAQSDGNAHFEMTDNIISLAGPNSIVGRAVIVHAGRDDLKSQPTGNAGGRVACGVIGYSQ